MTVPTILVTIGLANLIYDLTGFIIKCFNRTKRENDIEKIDMCNRSYVQALREMDNYATYITHKHNDQIVYKVDGDFNGDIKGDNVTVILMGDGNFNGNIDSNDGNVVLIKGNINGDVKANKIICPTEPTTEDKDQYICKSCYHYVQASTGSYCSESSASCGIPQGTSPQKRIDHCTSISNHISTYGSHQLAHIKCPHCKKYFATQLRVQTAVVDGDVAWMSVEEMRHDY